MWGTVRPCGAKCRACYSAVSFVYVILVGSTSHFMFCVLKRDNPDSFTFDMFDVYSTMGGIEFTL